MLVGSDRVAAIEARLHLSLVSEYEARVAPLALLVSFDNAQPQSPQKFACGGFSDPHLGQCRPSVAPQRIQNFLPAAFSNSQLEQRIVYRRTERTD
jgi:hypothetical protein